MDKLFHLVSGYITLAFKSLVISGHSSSMFGKYFKGQRNHKNMTNSCACCCLVGHGELGAKLTLAGRVLNVCA